MVRESISAVTDTDTTMPVSTRPLGTGLMYASTLVTLSTTIGAALPAIYPFSARNKYVAVSMILSPIIFLIKFFCNKRLEKPMPNRIMATASP